MTESIFNYKLKEFCAVGDGSHSSIPRQENGVMYLTSKNFKATGLDLSKLDYISEVDFEKNFEKSKSALVKPVEGDVLFGIIGKFKVKATPAREGRNPSTGATIQIKAAKKLSFGPAKAVKDRLNG